MWKIKIKTGLNNQLQKYLFEDSSTENGCFLKTFCKQNQLFITGIIKPKKESWITKDEGSFIPTSEYILYASDLAEENACGLAFIHSHPHELHPSTFSEIDLISNDLLFENLESIIEKPIGSFVFKNNTMHGKVYEQGVIQDVESFHVLGKNYRKVIDAENANEHLDEAIYDRQIKFIGNERHEQLSNLKIAIVGAGGIGSPLIFQLAKIGVRNIVVFDGDRIDKSNIPRIYGAKESDVGRYKVDVIKEFVESNTNAKITVYPDYVIDEDIRLIEADLIMGGLDNHTARDLLNTISINNAIPYIDSACAIPLNLDGDVEQALTQISVVMDAEACLWCLKTLDSNAMREENLSEEEKEVQIEQGYYSGIDKVPSVIFQTSMVASLAISRLFNLLEIFESNYPNKSIFEMSGGMLIDTSIVKDPKCPFHNSPFNHG